LWPREEDHGGLLAADQVMECGMNRHWGIGRTLARRRVEVGLAAVAATMVAMLGPARRMVAISADDVFLAANWALLISLIAGVVATWAIVVSGKIRDENLRRELKAADERTAELQAANLKLESQIAPRRVNFDQQKGIAAALSSFAGEKVVVRSYMLDAEAAVVGGQIIDVLKVAKIDVDDRRMSESSAGSIAMGVHVVGDNKFLVGGLLTALGNIGQLSVSSDPPPPPVFSVGGGGEVYGPATIFVGVKPIDGAK
jgi:hypothetical protein